MVLAWVPEVGCMVWSAVLTLLKCTNPCYGVQSSFAGGFVLSVPSC